MSSDVELDGSGLRRVIDALSRAIVVTDDTGTIVLWSNSAEQLYGWREDEVLGRSIFEILGPEAAEHGEEILAALTGGHPHRGTQQVTHRDGHSLPVLTVTSAVTAPDGRLEYVVGATDDLAEAAALELQTQALSIHLRLALEAGKLGTWRWDMATGLTVWDPEMERTFGLEPGTFDGTFDAWMALVHPDDREDAVRVVEDAVARKGHYRLEHRVVTPSGTVRWIEGAGCVTFDAAGTVTGTIGCSHDITDRAEAEQERERLTALAVDALARERVQRERLDRTARTDAALANLGRRLAASATVDDVLAVIGDHAPPVLGATAATVGLVHDARAISMVGAGDRVVALGDAGPLAVALEREEPVVHLGAAAGDDPPGWSDTPLVASPLYDDVHQTMGVLVLTWEQDPTLDGVDLNAIETLSRLCGQAIVRAQLAGHTEQLANLAASMAAAKTTREVAELLRAQGVEGLGAAVTNLRLVDPDTASLLPVLPTPVPPAIAERYQRIPLDAHLPLTDSIRDREPVWIPDLEAYRHAYPEVAGHAEEAGLEATAVLPLCDSDGEPMGAVALAWPTAKRFDTRFRSRLSTLAGLAAQTLERVQLFEAEHAVVASMQRRLLTPLPAVEGVAMAAYYEPATSPVGMGGDWYEAVVLDDGTAVVVIGDVVGHGVDAIAVMAQIQHLLTGLLRSGTPLGEVLARANSMIVGPEPVFATALLLHLDPANERVGYCGAGHPWALLRRPGGAVELLDGNQHPMIGVHLDPAELVYVPMPVGSSLLAYTDGLVERRDETIDRGIERLVGAFEETGADVGFELNRIVDRVRADDPEQRATVDDVAAILIHALPAEARIDAHGIGL